MDLRHINTPLARYCVRNNLNVTEFAVLVSKSYSRALAYLKPFDHPAFRVPPLGVMRILFIESEGELSPDKLVPLDEWREELQAELAEAAA